VRSRPVGIAFEGTSARSQFLVFGEARNFCVARITLDADVMITWAIEKRRMDGSSYTELVKSPEVQRLIDEHIAKLNVGLNRWETIKKWALLDRDPSIQTGELTPSLKVKRTVIAERYREMLDAFYA